MNRMKNRYIALVLAVFMMLSAHTVLVSARETDELPTGSYFYYRGESAEQTAKITDSYYRPAFELLRYLGILYDDMLAVDDEATRGLAAQIFGAMKFKSLQEATQAPFSDVASGHVYADGIFTALQAGVIDNEGGKFRPNDSVTMNEAVEMAIRTLGYNEAPDVFLRSSAFLGIKRDLMKGINSVEGKLTNGELMFLALNTFELPIFNPTTFSIDANGEFSILSSADELKKGKTLLDESNIIREQGVVTALANYSMFISKRPAGNTVSINRKDYKTVSKLPAEYFGKSIYAYVDTTDGHELLITAWEDVSANNVISGMESDFTFVSDTRASYYDEDGKKREARIASDALAIYNMETGVSMEQAHASGIVARADEIVLIDNDDDNVIDVVLLREYDYRVIDGFSGEDKIYFKYEKDKIDTDDILYMTFQGEDITRADLKIGDVAMVMSTSRYGDESYGIMISRSVAGGVLQSISQEGGALCFDVGGKMYKASNFYEEYYYDTTIASNESRPELGDAVAFSLADNGLIVASTAGGSSAWSYGYLATAGYAKRGLSDAAQVKLYDISTYTLKTFTLEDEIELYTWPDTESSYIIDAKATPEEVYTALKDGDAYKTDMVAYKVDKDGNLDSLATEYTGGMGDTPFVSSYPLVKNYSTDMPNAQNRLYMHILGLIYNIRNKPAIMVPPNGVSDSDRVNKGFYKEWEYLADYYLSKDDPNGDSMAIYNSDVVANAGFVIYKPKFSDAASGITVGAYSAIAIISEKKTVVNNEGDVVTRLYYPSGESVASIDLSTEVEFSVVTSGDDYYGKPLTVDDIDSGDIIQWETDNYGNAGAIRFLFNNDDRGSYRCQYGTDTVTTGTGKMFGTGLVLTWGKVKEAQSKALIQTLPDGDFPMFFTGIRDAEHTGGTSYYLYDSARRKAIQIPFTEIRKDDEVVVISDYNVSYRAYVYR